MAHIIDTVALKEHMLRTAERPIPSAPNAIAALAMAGVSALARIFRRRALSAQLMTVFKDRKRRFASARVDLEEPAASESVVSIIPA